jgi:hypothetical protein
VLQVSEKIKSIDVRIDLLMAYNAPGKAQKYVGVAFALFAKGMTTYFCRSLPDCYVLNFARISSVV